MAMLDLQAFEHWRHTHPNAAAAPGQDFLQLLADNKLCVPEWPEQCFGSSYSPLERLTWYRYCLQHNLPLGDIVGIEIVGPIMLIQREDNQFRTWLKDIADRKTTWGFSSFAHHTDVVISPAGIPDLVLQLIDMNDGMVQVDVVRAISQQRGTGVYSLDAPVIQASFLTDEQTINQQIQRYRAVPVTARLQAQVVHLQQMTECAGNAAEAKTLIELQVETDALTGTTLRAAAANDPILAGAVTRIQERLAWQCFYEQQALEGYAVVEQHSEPGSNEPQIMSPLIQTLSVMTDAALLKDALSFYVTPPTE